MGREPAASGGQSAERGAAAGPGRGECGGRAARGGAPRARPAGRRRASAAGARGRWAGAQVGRDARRAEGAARRPPGSRGERTPRRKRWAGGRRAGGGRAGGPARTQAQATRAGQAARASRGCGDAASPPPAAGAAAAEPGRNLSGREVSRGRQGFVRPTPGGGSAGEAGPVPAATRGPRGAGAGQGAEAGALGPGQENPGRAARADTRAPSCRADRGRGAFPAVDRAGSFPANAPAFRAPPHCALGTWVSCLISSRPWGAPGKREGLGSEVLILAGRGRWTSELGEPLGPAGSLMETIALIIMP